MVQGDLTHAAGIEDGECCSSAQRSPAHAPSWPPQPVRLSSHVRVAHEEPLALPADAAPLASATKLRNLWLDLPPPVPLPPPTGAWHAGAAVDGGEGRSAESASGLNLGRARRSRGVGVRSAGELLA